MDPFAQRMLEKAQVRSRNLGITDATRCPLTENIGKTDANTAGAAIQALEQRQLQKNTPATPSHTTASPANRLQVVERTPADAKSSSSGVSPKKVLRHFSAVDKENMDLGIEINIMTDKNIEVEVQVEEQEISDHDGSQPQMTSHSDEVVNQPIARIRDTSRNRLQRLGALYSNTADLSSPIHRTEGNFHAGSNEDNGTETSPKKPKQRYDKLVALANSINQWEDDVAHPSQGHLPSGVPPPKPELPSRKLFGKKANAPPPPSMLTKPSNPTDMNNKTKQLKWDPKVIDSLEAQGFQRRDSSTIKLAYDYGKSEAEEKKQQSSKQSTTTTNKPATSKWTTSSAAAATEPEKKVSAVKPGLVSGRAAAFEYKTATSKQQQGPPQKDPTELSLKERMKLFEKNKGEALLPKAPFAMAPPISKLRPKEESKASTALSSSSSAAHNPALASLVKSGSDSKVRDKVAALVANATISETNIREEIQKQRQEDMQILANRFNKQRELFSKENLEPQTNPAVKSQAATKQMAVKPMKSKMGPPPPPPPPPPSSVMTTASLYATTTKRRSPGDAIDDESKRVKKTNDQRHPGSKSAHRLYPTLSDLGSDESFSDNENMCTTATVSGRSTVDEPIRGRDIGAGIDDADNDSYMESEADDSSVGICDGSLGREIMHAVHKNEHHNSKHEQLPHHHQRQPQHSRQPLQQHHHHHHYESKQQQQQRPIKEVHYAGKNLYYGEDGGDSSINSSDASVGVDDYLDEAFGMHVHNDGDDDFTQESDDDDYNDRDASKLSAGSKGTTASNSFSFRKVPGKYSGAGKIVEEPRTPETSKSSNTNNNSSSSGQKSNSVHFAPPVTSELSVNHEDDNMVTLVHTVSFYRRQQTANSANSTPVRKICREQQVLRSAVEGAASAAMHFESQQSPSRNDDSTDSYLDTDDGQTDSDTDDAELVQEKIKKLLDEVCKQQQVIAQTSQALNLCAATIEFSGSMESVEGERHLLVATHRRQACLDEVQRLRVEKSLRPLGAPKEKGRLTVKEITLPLRQDYIRKLAADTISGHHLVCLLKYNEHVLATRTVPTLPGLLAVKFPDELQLNNVYADFRITLEIYGMTAQREVLPHEVKYHINLNKKSGIKTPKKKGNDNRLVMPPVQSPGGPHVVRTPALVQYGFAIFSLREIQRTTWSLTQVLGVCPLEGIVHMKVNCELSVSVEYKGFLTMFEDISGFGAWHRRWCHLNGTMLNYWKYPDDERKTTPMGSIDLYTCVSQKVTTAPRDICARLNTMLLECQRPARDTDRESLIIVPNGRTTIVRHLLSADTKEEREAWCAYFNKALTLLRAWGPPQ